MSLEKLNYLVKIGQLKIEPMNKSEFEGLVHSGETRLTDALRATLSLESQFDLSYNAAHSLSLAALRWHGFRSSNRYIVFQVLPFTLSLGSEVWRVLAKCHEQRNLSEYEGHLEVEEILVADLLSATQKVLQAVKSLTAPR